MYHECVGADNLRFEPWGSGLTLHRFRIKGVSEMGGGPEGGSAGDAMSFVPQENVSLLLHVQMALPTEGINPSAQLVPQAVPRHSSWSPRWQHCRRGGSHAGSVPSVPALNARHVLSVHCPQTHAEHKCIFTLNNVTETDRIFKKGK